MVTIETYQEHKVVEDDDADAIGTKSLGCGNGFSGGRCADGSDTSDCVYESMSQQGAGKCVGVMHMVKIPDSYECKDQRGNYKCLLNQFDSVDQCKKTCPGKCIGFTCQVANTE